MQQAMIANIGQQMQDEKVASLIERVNALGSTQALVANLKTCHQSLKNPANLAKHSDAFAWLNATALTARFHSFAVALTTFEIQRALGQITDEVLLQSKAAVVEQIKLQTPAFMSKISSSIIEVPIKEIVENLQNKLLRLVEANDVSELTVCTAKYSLEKMSLLAEYIKIEDLSQRALVLNEFGARIQAELFRYLAMVSNDTVNSTGFSKIYSEFISMMSALQNFPTEKGILNLAKLSLLNVPLNQRSTSIYIYTHAMCTEIASEFYGHVLFDYTPPVEEFTKYLNSSPKLVELSLKAVVLSACGSVIQLDQDHFFENIFSVIRDSELQKTCIKLFAESVLSCTPQIFADFIEVTFTSYCEQYPDTAETQMLEQLSKEFLAKLQALQIPQIDLEDSDDVADLQFNMGTMLQNLTDTASNKM